MTSSLNRSPARRASILEPRETPLWKLRGRGLAKREFSARSQRQTKAVAQLTRGEQRFERTDQGPTQFETWCTLFRNPEPKAVTGNR